ncbi:MAG: hypothetical protein IJ831_06055 [Spirochaetales bacterium]|nr:hypothetical protein [Spirochaetales bacterium]
MDLKETVRLPFPTYWTDIRKLDIAGAVIGTGRIQTAVSKESLFGNRENKKEPDSSGKTFFQTIGDNEHSSSRKLYSSGYPDKYSHDSYYTIRL